jgi:putative FmdB family regulatory protein
MPTYEYRCPKGHEFELFQRMSDEPRTACPECGETAQRLISAGAGLIFKGEGFYITDHRSDEYKKAASSEKETASGDKGGDSTEKKPSTGASEKKESTGAKPSDAGGGSSGGSASEPKGTSSGASSGSGQSASSDPSTSSSPSGSSGRSRSSDSPKPSSSDA